MEEFGLTIMTLDSSDRDHHDDHDDHDDHSDSDDPDSDEGGIREFRVRIPPTRVDPTLSLKPSTFQLKSSSSSSLAASA